MTLVVLVEGFSVFSVNTEVFLSSTVCTQTTQMEIGVTSILTLLTSTTPILFLITLCDTSLLQSH